ncbi:hypothetical protein [Thiocapsa bogorovii]|uniref:hypothetical protein n=1 Tax=Thiocapsa bogorovii TaxID=521689 RepID=UPI001E56FA9A|nr:hypothetical protein [Thiocapsa bogorovii]UHD16231.1 hypothetical protein LT988_23795 [Thiocapsa bogorovii]
MKVTTALATPEATNASTSLENPKRHAHAEGTLLDFMQRKQPERGVTAIVEQQILCIGSGEIHRANWKP